MLTFKNMHIRGTRDYSNQLGLSRAALFNQVEGSLERLGTTYVDLLQIHRGDLDNVTAEETMKALHDLVQSGKVRYIGASSMWTWQFQHYNHVAEVGWLAICTHETKLTQNIRRKMVGRPSFPCKTSTPLHTERRSAKCSSTARQRALV